jgi:hypothetical protein
MSAAPICPSRSDVIAGCDSTTAAETVTVRAGATSRAIQYALSA